jgi:uncharacterized protein YdeI (YjbR/CyaY-like superfamily)
MATSKDGLPVRTFASSAAFERWLEAHADGPGVWLRIAKAGGSGRSVTYAAALESALCFGWVDGQKAAGDEGWWLQRFTPRRPGSAWSKINCAKADALAEAGRLRPRGHVEVAAAKSDGRWQAAYAGQRTAEVPPDLQAALDASPSASAFFTTLSRANRYAVLYRIGSVKRPETRARKIAQYVEMLEAGRTIHPQP